MNLTFESYTLGELREGLVPESLWEEPDIPVSSFRVASYIHNPRGMDEDVILYIVRDDDRLVGYRTLLPDDLLIEAKKIHFAWLSGFWVHPDYRRLGIGLKIQQSVLDNWKAVLGIDNTPINRKVMEKSHSFSQLPDKQGIRVFFKSPIKYLTKQKGVKNNLIIKFAAFTDKIINWVYAFKLITYKRKLLPVKCHYKLASNIDDESSGFIDNYEFYSIINRRSVEFKWIFNYPWIYTNDKARDENLQYYFSVYAHEYKLECIKVYYKSELKALIVVGLRDGILKVHYLFGNDNDYNIIMTSLMDYIHKNKVQVLISHHQEWQSYLLRYSKHRIFYKNTLRRYMVNNELIKMIEPYFKQLKDGDGDAVFV